MSDDRWRRGILDTSNTITDPRWVSEPRGGAAAFERVLEAARLAERVRRYEEAIRELDEGGVLVVPPGPLPLADEARPRSGAAVHPGDPRGDMSEPGAALALWGRAGHASWSVRRLRRAAVARHRRRLPLGEDAAALLGVPEVAVEWPDVFSPLPDGCADGR